MHFQLGEGLLREPSFEALGLAHHDLYLLFLGVLWCGVLTCVG